MVSDKKVGIIGGVGPQSTDFIYEKVIQLAQKKYDAKNNADYPHLLIESIPIPDFISNKDKINEALELLKQSVRSLTTAGCTRLCIGSNTVHILLEDLRKETDVEFISMVELVANKCKERASRKVAVLGTPVLLESGLYTKELRDKDIEVVLPTEEQISIIEDIIRSVIAGNPHHEKKQEYINTLNDLFSKGAELVILGCTELPLAINYEALGNKTVNSDEVLAEGIVDYYYKNE